MKSEKRRRNSLRLAGYDYTRPSDYYVTICTYQRESYLSTIEDRRSVLLPFGILVKKCWDALPRHYDNLALGEFVIMPNHIHGIITLTETKEILPRPHLSEVVRWFKSFSGRHINRLRKMHGGRVWQRGYYDHILQDDEERFYIRHYIVENPLKWEMDRLHPNHPDPFPMEDE